MQKDRYKEKQKDYGNATLTNDKTKETERHPKPKESEDDKTEHTLSNGTGTHDEAIETKRNGEPLFGDENQNKSKTDEIMGIKTTSVSEINCDLKNKLHKNEKCTLYLQNRAALPFPGACRSFYARQYAKVTKNIKRQSRRVENPVLRNENNNIGMQRGKMEGTLDQNIESIEKQIKECRDEAKRVQLLAIAEVAKELKKVILMKTFRALEIYKTAKVKFTKTNVQESLTSFRAVDTYEMLSKYLNVAQIYIDQQAFIVESSGTDIEKVVNSISRTLEHRRTGSAIYV